jgi:predicted nucleic acid-binding protein
MMIPINDIWIAALAIEANLPILARDEHFARVAGLSVISCSHPWLQLSDAAAST